MAIITNAFPTYTAKGNREDLSDVIYNIDPTDTPFVTAIGRRNVSNVTFDWQTENLPAVSTTAELEGFELSRSAGTATENTKRDSASATGPVQPPKRASA